MNVYSDKPLGWVMGLGRVDYELALTWQRGLVKLRREGMARDTILLLEHPPVITVGRDGHEENFKECKVDPFFVERGGDVTYHGPGQLVGYFIFNLTRRGRDLHKFMADLQNGIVRTLDNYGVKASLGDEHTGVWVGKKKIASIGVAVKNWITFHGVAINLNTDLSEFTKINPCGLDAEIMTSLAKETGKKIKDEEFRQELVKNYSEVFDTRFDPITLDFIAEDVESQSGGNVI
jgi:lipoate-protein ligase B